VIDTNNSASSSVSGGGGKQLSSGVIAGLAVVGTLLLSALVLLGLGLLNQRKSRKGRSGYAQMEKSGGVGVEWADLSYVVPGAGGSKRWLGRTGGSAREGYNDDKVVLDGLSGSVQAGQIMAILGPSGKFTKSFCSSGNLSTFTCFQVPEKRPLSKFSPVGTNPDE
jgi:hypothetical protein